MTLKEYTEALEPALTFAQSIFTAEKPPVLLGISCGDVCVRISMLPEDESAVACRSCTVYSAKMLDELYSGDYCPKRLAKVLKNNNVCSIIVTTPALWKNKSFKKRFQIGCTGCGACGDV